MTHSSLRFAALAVWALLSACSSPQAETPSPQSTPPPAQAQAAELKEIDVDALKQRLDAREDLFLLDVRSAEELEKDGLIEGSVHIPIADLEKRLAEIPKDKPVAIYCAVGRRAQRAAEALRQNGYTQPIEYGGIVSWVEKGYPIAPPSSGK